MTSERAIVRAILDYLNGLPVCVARKRWGGGMGVAGEPDIDACVHGRSLQLEVKRPGQTPTMLQLKRLGEWSAAGAIVGVVVSVDETKALLVKEAMLSHSLHDSDEKTKKNGKVVFARRY